MGSKLTQSWIPLDKIEAIAQLEPLVFVLLVAATSWILYKLFLSELSPERHRNLRKQFQNLLFHSVFAIAVFVGYWLLLESNEGGPFVGRVLPYLGLLTVIWGAIVFVKTCRIFAFEYLFFFNMQVGVPLLIVNLLSLLLSLWVGGWILSNVFEFRLAPLLATSAAFSIVLGLAMQDTLGNLFAGVALQLDKPFAIGDWIEVYIGSQKVVGLVNEITWRAVVLVGFTEEIIHIPNRILAQSQVSNFSGKTNPIIKSQVFRIPYGQDLTKVREILLAACEGIKGLRRHPEPIVLLNESTESWLAVKLVYYLDDYGAQYIVADRLLQKILFALDQEGLPLASPKIEVVQTKKSA